MTTITAVSPKEFLPIGASSSRSTSSPAKVVYREFPPSKPLPQLNTLPLEAIARKHEADPRKAQLLARARKNLATTVYANEPETLSSLRLAAGMSQVQLACQIGTSQPHIARIERGQNDPGTDMIVRIAQALKIEEDRVFRAIRNQLALRDITE